MIGVLRLKVIEKNWRNTEAFLKKDVIKLSSAILKKHYDSIVKPEVVGVVMRSYPEEKAIRDLCAGQIVPSSKNRFSHHKRDVLQPSGVVGDSVQEQISSGRFLSHTYIGDALRRDKTRSKIDFSRRTAKVLAGNKKQIRRLTRFRWKMATHSRRWPVSEGETEPYGHQYLSVLERGGSIKPFVFRQVSADRSVAAEGRSLQSAGGSHVWIVTPRSNSYLLHPEAGVRVTKMRKTIKPIGMFRRGLKRSEYVFVKNFLNELKMMIRAKLHK